MHLAESKQSPKTTELLSVLGENVRHLLLRADIDQVDVARQDSLSNIVVVDLYMFGPGMEHWVPSQFYAAKVVAMDDNLLVHLNSHVAK